jgi:hypothetical protein
MYVPGRERRVRQLFNNSNLRAGVEDTAAIPDAIIEITAAQRAHAIAPLKDKHVPSPSFI